MKKITVVIPALNEERGIGLVLKEIPVSTLMNMGYETEVMVIDNGSKDKTCHIARFPRKNSFQKSLQRKTGQRKPC